MRPEGRRQRPLRPASLLDQRRRRQHVLGVVAGRAFVRGELQQLRGVGAAVARHPHVGGAGVVGPRERRPAALVGGAQRDPLAGGQREHGGGGLAAPGDGRGEHGLDARRRHGLRAAKGGVALGQRAAPGQPFRQLLAHPVQGRGVARRWTHAQGLGGFIGKRRAGAGEPAGRHGQGAHLPGEVAPAHGLGVVAGVGHAGQGALGLADPRLDGRDRLTRAVAPRGGAEPGVHQRRLVPRQRQRETNVELGGLIRGDRRGRRRHAATSRHQRRAGRRQRHQRAAPGKPASASRERRPQVFISRAHQRHRIGRIFA